jgi:hypothetical protein
MPNGGSDNCNSCKFNKFNQSDSQSPPDRMRKAYCIIRDTTILSVLWTYCVNYHTGSDIPDGPIFSVGIYDENRIPWWGKNKPKIVTSGLCNVCRKKIEKGIEVQINNKENKQFCCDQHYVKWWKKKNPHIKIAWDIEKT